MSDNDFDIYMNDAIAKRLRREREEEPKVPATHFVELLRVNVDNVKLTDEAFREFVRSTLQIVENPDE